MPQVQPNTPNASEMQASAAPSPASAEISDETLQRSLSILDRLAGGEYQEMTMESENGRVVQIIVTYGDGEGVEMLELFSQYVIWSRTRPANAAAFRDETTLSVIQTLVDISIQAGRNHFNDFDWYVLDECSHHIRSQRIEAIVNAPPPVGPQSQHDSAECPICLEESCLNTFVNLRCQTTSSHRFHKTCIEVWLRENDHCPLCRSRV